MPDLDLAVDHRLFCDGDYIVETRLPDGRRVGMTADQALDLAAALAEESSICRRLNGEAGPYLPFRAGSPADI
ncbi:MAG: hypothetical protein JO157_05935 [Acetobacteraceae bacterium]|nr:hypothetical protein [Acetobacteraceae bacterium]